ncbi:Sugar or nucleoside kinase, ribokinase family [Cribrihabitans marinus]|uniref:Sugar or nucleoside kinase, ribokinase family n=1 Tax=Cribrihabitans marinus TaxID=1227549 RepID=A0A1H7DE84_9RHOB|nr:sugar kinase [Cribrihabitans marinus]GGH38027.1 sugar kinase [Cribrihabitans marinus]SEJ97862.1 Sugar or nucleoside kinase, ribokinase family [Cribrihabitans marinus]
MKKIAVIGEILVEIMADRPGLGFFEPLALTGPYPSGAPAIFIDQVARLGQPCGIVSSVGHDDFGQINLSRLQADGVDVSAVSIDPARPTGSAFVRYREDGARDFIFNIEHAACGRITLTPQAEHLFQKADHLHVMGSSLSSDRLVEINLAAAETIKARGGTLSFDPNLRKEMLSRQEMRAAMQRILGMTDLFLPSGEELTLLTEAARDQDALAELLGQGVRAIVHKQGAKGAEYHDADGSVRAPAFPVEEIDPTGAGDCFGATFTTHWLRGTDPERALRLAAAAGALAVGKRGPMEGTSDGETIEAFIKHHEGDV